ncbi:MAG: hypothetical protein Fur0020_08430 [Thermodesulfovibrionia bacterium]
MDSIHDLLIGDADGYIHVYLNKGENGNPMLEDGHRIAIGGVSIGVGGRATPESIDWNNDGRDDLIVGSIDGSVFLFLNTSNDRIPSFTHPTRLAFKNGKPINVGVRSAPRVFDLDGDGKKDLLIGEVMGYVYFLRNVGSDESPAFERAERLRLMDGMPLKYPINGARSRLSISDWDDDGIHDILIGGMDGRVMLFKGLKGDLRIRLKRWIVIRVKELFER